MMTHPVPGAPRSPWLGPAILAASVLLVVSLITVALARWPFASPAPVEQPAPAAVGANNVPAALDQHERHPALITSGSVPAALDQHERHPALITSGSVPAPLDQNERHPEGIGAATIAPTDPLILGVLDYLRAHGALRPGAVVVTPLDPAAQGVMDYLRAHEALGPGAVVVTPLDPAAQGVMDYLRAHEALGPGAVVVTPQYVAIVAPSARMPVGRMHLIEVNTAPEGMVVVGTADTADPLRGGPR